MLLLTKTACSLDYVLWCWGLPHHSSCSMREALPLQLKSFIQYWYVGLLSTYSEAISMFQQYLGPSEGYSTTRRTQVHPGMLLLPDNIWWLYDVSLLIYPYDFDKDVMLILIYRLSKDCIFAHEASRKYFVKYNQSNNSSSIFKPAVIQGLLIVIEFWLLTRVSIQTS